MRTYLRKIRNKHKVLLETLGTSTLIILYIMIELFIIAVYMNGRYIYRIPHFIRIDRVALCGILEEMQIVVFILLIVLYEKKGYIIAMGMCIVSLVIQSIPLLLHTRMPSVIGYVMMFSGGVLNTITYCYCVRMKRQQKKLHEMAVYDGLTGLVNRRTIIEELERLIRDYKNEVFSVVFIDIDNFKKINDSAGHTQGDILLKEVTEAWKKIIAKEDVLGRIGGDEFALIIKEQLTREKLVNYINQLEMVLSKEHEINKRTYNFTASYGIATYPEDTQKAEHLLKYADIAMHEAKKNGRNNIKFFTEKMYEEMVLKMKMEEALSKALENNELYLMYQPQYGCHKKELRGFEALLRWDSKEFGKVSPAQFIPIAEKTGLIIEIGDWVLETACRTFKGMAKTYGSEKILSVNISALQLLEVGFVDRVKEIIVETEFNPKYLEFEITESVFISSKEYIIKILDELKQLGIHIALDDFGTSYASLSYIQMLPLDVLKIDKSFIDDILEVGKKNNLVGVIIALAQQLNYKVVAEGIEKIEQIRYLDERGCDYIQGYLWGKPLMESEVNLLLEKVS